MEIDVQKLKELRRQRVLTVRELAERAGVSKTTVSSAENTGRAYPSTIRKIARALDIEPAELVK